MLKLLIQGRTDGAALTRHWRQTAGLGRTSSLLIVSENCRISEGPGCDVIGVPSSSATAKPANAVDAERTADHKQARLVGMERHTTLWPVRVVRILCRIPMPTADRA